MAIKRALRCHPLIRGRPSINQRQYRVIKYDKGKILIQGAVNGISESLMKQLMDLFYILKLRSGYYSNYSAHQLVDAV